MPNELAWQEIAQDVSRDRRESKRVQMNMPITITGVHSDGNPFSFVTRTTNISEQGCCFSSDDPFELHEIFSITVNHRRSNGSHRFQVTRIEPRENGQSVGARLIQLKNVWGMTFPPKHGLRKTPI